MNNTTVRIALIAAGSILCLSGCDTSDDTNTTRDSQATQARGTSTTQADNTGRNRDDARRNAMTPIDQSQETEHVELTGDIRRAVLADETLSMGAKNCKIITDKSGKVWLRGPVDSQAEKELIERIARRIAGEDAVTNQLEVKTD